MRGFVIRVRLLRPRYQVTIGPDAIMPAHVHRGRFDWTARWFNTDLSLAPFVADFFFLALFVFFLGQSASHGSTWCGGQP